MSRYIDANAFKNQTIKFGEEQGSTSLSKWLCEYIDCFSTADVVEVVRCKDCKYSKFIYSSKKKGESSVGHYVCTSRRCSTVAEGYCHWGERRENGKS